MLEKQPEAGSHGLEALFAVAKLGAILTPINHRLEGPGVEALFRDAAPRVVLLNGTPADLTVPREVASSGAPGAVLGPAESVSALVLKLLSNLCTKSFARLQQPSAVSLRPLAMDLLPQPSAAASLHG